MSRVLVTGASGLIGRRVTGPLAAAGHEVHGVARNPPREGGPIRWHVHDLLASPDILDAVAPEIVVHLAWDVTPGRFWSADENSDWADASIALFERFAAIGGQRFIGAGTCAEYDWDAEPDGLLVESRTPLSPATVYGQSKNYVRMRCDALTTHGGPEFAWGRVFFLYAPDEDPRRLFGSVARALLSGQSAPTSPGTQVRDFLHADDVGAAFATLAQADGVTGAVNIGSGAGVAVRDIVEEIGRATERSECLRIGALPAAPEAPRLVADVSRLRDEVGFTPRYGLRDGIEAAVRALGPTE